MQVFDFINFPTCSKLSFTFFLLFNMFKIFLSFFDTIINKLNKDIKSCTSNQFYRKNNTTRIEFLNSNKRNKSFKDSYSKYYLNKLEMENKFLIPQLSKKTDDFFNINFFNRNQF